MCPVANRNLLSTAFRPLIIWCCPQILVGLAPHLRFYNKFLQLWDRNWTAHQVPGGQSRVSNNDPDSQAKDVAETESPSIVGLRWMGRPEDSESESLSVG